MNNLTALQSRKKNIARLNRNSKLFKSILTAIKDKKAENIVSLDLRKIPEAVADFFVICQASNAPQLKAIADNVEAEAKKNCNELAFKHEGRKASGERESTNVTRRPSLGNR